MHFAPVATTMDVDEDDADEDKGSLDYSSIASLARPLQKREKKGLDLSRWKELPAGESAAPHDEVRKKHEPAVSRKAAEEGKFRCMEKAKAAAPDDRLTSEEEKKSFSAISKTSTPGEVSVVVIRNEEGKKDAIMRSNQGPTAMDVEMEGLGRVASHGGHSTIMEEIDAENLARLRQMSPQDIAEAQTEILEKMDPAILTMLKKRGQQKRSYWRAAPCEDKERRNGNFVKKVEGGKRLLQDKTAKIEGSKSSWKLDTEQVKSATLQTSETSRAYGEWFSSGVSNSSLWKAWSERVEKVRGLRFTLDGNAIGDDPSHQLENDGTTCFSQYNPENVTERDFLRTEGEPGAAGYTINEAIALVRSIIPGQRCFALQLLASVLGKCLFQLQQIETHSGFNITKSNRAQMVIDWQAVWAFALGPEPELALSLRIALDDNHNSVVLACSKAIQCILCYDETERYFEISEKLCIYEKDVYTAPVFRSRPEINFGYLRGGFWKYSAKPSNISSFAKKDGDAENEENRTIQDDVLVAGQDVAAGLVRMGILPRICYLLEMDPLLTLVESLVCILVALARHSPSCATAIMKCPRLIETVVRRFNEQHKMEAYISKIKSVLLLRILAQADKQNCLEFVKRGFFEQTVWHMFKVPISLDHWVMSGKEHCKFSSRLMVEQLRFWKVCVRYGYCISYFNDFFPSMCMWLNLPTFEKLNEGNILGEFASVAREVYHVLEVLCHRLPRLHSVEQLDKEISGFPDSVEFWSWSHVVPMVELAVKWLSLKSIPYTSSILVQKKIDASLGNCSSISSILWVISAVLHMLASVTDKIVLKEVMSSEEGKSTVLPWLPFFIPAVGLEIVKNGFFNFPGVIDTVEETSAKSLPFVDVLSQLRSHNELETSFSSVSCLHGLVQLVYAIDICIQSAKGLNPCQPQNYSDMDGKILEDGMTKWACTDLQKVFFVFKSSIASEWQTVQSIDIFGRGGPAPGIGLGWGSSGGGFWSMNYLYAEADAHLIMSLFRIFCMVPGSVEGMKLETGNNSNMMLAIKKVNALLGICLASGPRDVHILEKAFYMLLQVPVLEFMGLSAIHFIQIKGLRSFEWRHSNGDYQFISNTLNTHFRNMWLIHKSKTSADGDSCNSNFKPSKKHCSLETIQEDVETSETANESPKGSSLLAEWALQKLPIPVHWFLSPLSCIDVSGKTAKVYTSALDLCPSSDHLDAAKSGLFMLLGLEALSYLANLESCVSPIAFVPLVWKLHALSMTLVVRMDMMGVLEDERSRDIYETLQELYGRFIDQIRLRNDSNGTVGLEETKAKTISLEGLILRKPVKSHDQVFLEFQSQIHESYITFLDMLVEQFGAISYGNILYGRQVALYLHRSVEAAVRLAAWNSMTNARVLELLPSLDKCVAEAEGYLEPIEDNGEILQAYCKSWVSGALDKACARGSMSFILAMHHLSSFIFYTSYQDRPAVRNKLVKSLIRGCTRNPQNERMLLNLIQYRRYGVHGGFVGEDTLLHEAESERRFGILSTACEGNSSLLGELANLKFCRKSS